MTDNSIIRFLKKNETKIVLLLVVAVAAALRLWKLHEFPFVHDEFSALLRTRFDSFGQLIAEGVVPDAHPAGVQVFLYVWVKIFGWSEFWVKLPFALCGIASVFLVYKIAARWFGNTTGLLLAVFVAGSQFYVYYSQIARPYSSGLFFVLLFVYFWNKVLFDDKHPSIWVCVGFALSAWAAALSHHFATAQAGLVFVTGLFFVPRSRSKAYWLSGLAALVLYAPNFPIFHHQLFVNGGVGGWLGAPEPSFVTNFFRYALNHSQFVMFVVAGVAVLPFVAFGNKPLKSKMRLVVLLWFVVPFAMAYVYSLLREPVLQFSTLYFCLPFFIMLLFSFVSPDIATAWRIVLPLGLLFVFVSTLIFDRKHYQIAYNQGYDQIPLAMKTDSADYGDVCFAGCSDNVFKLAFYEDKLGFDGCTNYSQAEFDGFVAHLDSCKSECFGFGCTDYTAPEWELAAVSRFPYQIHSQTWFNSKYLMLSVSSDSVPCLLQSFESKFDTIDMNGSEWGRVWEMPQTTLSPATDFFGVVADVDVAGDPLSCMLVIELRDSNDSLLLWHSSRDRVLENGNSKLVAAVRLDNYENARIRTYLWNRSQGNLKVLDVRWYAPQRHPYFMGLYEKL